MNPDRVLRTPDERFADLPDFPFPPNYTTVDGLRIHHVEAGPGDGPVVVLLHGEPSWSFLWRHVIRVLADGGCRVLAPDLVGFGRSDKPVDRSVHTYAAHVAWMRAWFEQLDLNDVTLVGQDWGSLIGLRVATEIPDRMARIVIANGGLPTGEERFPAIFRVWRRFAMHSPWFPVDRIVQAGCVRPVSAGVRRAYRAPFPDRRYLAGPRMMPRLVPVSPDHPGAADNRAAWQQLEQWDKPFLTAFSNGDPITRGIDRVLQKRIPGASGQGHTRIRGAGHFLQEDNGRELGKVVLGFMEHSPVQG